MPVIQVAQRFVVDSTLETLGVINVTQSFSVAGDLSFSSYTPLAEGGAVVWFDMQDAGSYTEVGGIAVTALVNKVSGVTWTPGVTSCPYEATGLASKPCLHPLAITDRMISTESAVLTALTSGVTGTIYYVVQPDAISQSGAVFAAAQIAGTNGQRRFGNINTGNGRYSSTLRNDAGAAVTNTTAQDYSTSRTVVCWTFDATTISCFANNVATSLAAAACAPGTLTPTRVGLFSVPDNSADTPFIGRFGELWLFNSVHDAAAQTRVYNYLAGRW